MLFQLIIIQPFNFRLLFWLFFLLLMLSGTVNVFDLYLPLRVSFIIKSVAFFLQLLKINWQWHEIERLLERVEGIERKSFCWMDLRCHKSCRTTLNKIVCFLIYELETQIQLRQFHDSIKKSFKYAFQYVLSIILNSKTDEWI